MKFEVAGIGIEFETEPDLFSPKGLDQGTGLLLNAVTKFQYDSLLDWGCGWGAIGLFAAKFKPHAKVVAIDSDLGAIKTARHNAGLNGLKNLEIVASHGFSEVPEDQKFDVICSNPPTHRGREVVDQMIELSKDRLTPAGKLVIVVEARLKPWVARQCTDVFGSYKILARSRKNVVILAQK